MSFNLSIESRAVIRSVWERENRRVLDAGTEHRHNSRPGESSVQLHSKTTYFGPNIGLQHLLKLSVIHNSVRHFHWKLNFHGKWKSFNGCHAFRKVFTPTRLQINWLLLAPLEADNFYRHIPLGRLLISRVRPIAVYDSQWNVGDGVSRCFTKIWLMWPLIWLCSANQATHLFISSPTCARKEISNTHIICEFQHKH